MRVLQALRKEKAERLDAQSKARFSIDAGAASGKLVVDVRRMSFRYGENTIIRDLSTRILRGDRLASSAQTARVNTLLNLSSAAQPTAEKWFSAHRNWRTSISIAAFMRTKPYGKISATRITSPSEAVRAM